MTPHHNVLETLDTGVGLTWTWNDLEGTIRYAPSYESETFSPLTVFGPMAVPISVIILLMVDEPIPATKVATVPQKLEMGSSGSNGQNAWTAGQSGGHGGDGRGGNGKTGGDGKDATSIGGNGGNGGHGTSGGWFSAVGTVVTATLGTALEMEQTVNEARTDQIYASPSSQSILLLSK